MMSKEQFERLMDKLDALIKITAVNVSQGKTIADVAILLSDFGFQNKEIATILGTTSHYIGTVKYEAGKKKKDKEAKRIARKQSKQVTAGVEPEVEQGKS
jgi:transcriptional regulator